MKRFGIIFAIVSAGFGAQVAVGATYDLVSDWSDAANPNGVWTYREGSNALPHVASWQAVLGGWAVAQPGWARSQDGNNRIPFWFKSNGSETFAHDFLTGDVVVHTTDGSNGVGNGLANVLWSAPTAGKVTISGGVWMGRDIDRSNHWAVLINGISVTGGDISSGDAFSRSSPFSLTAGTGGAASLTNIAVNAGDTVELLLTATSQSGDFVGTTLTINETPTPPTPEPGTLAMLAGAGLLMVRRRSRR